MTQPQDINTPEQALEAAAQYVSDYAKGFGEPTTKWLVEHCANDILALRSRIIQAPDQSAEVAAALERVLINLKTYWRPDSQPCCGELIIKKMITTAGQSALARREREAEARGRAEACAELRAELVQMKYGEERNVKKLSRQVAALTKEINTRDKILAADAKLREKK